MDYFGEQYAICVLTKVFVATILDWLLKCLNSNCIQSQFIQLPVKTMCIIGYSSIKLFLLFTVSACNYQMNNVPGLYSGRINLKTAVFATNWIVIIYSIYICAFEVLATQKSTLTK